LEKSEIRKIYDGLEPNVLILIAIPIPFFAFAYLHAQNGTAAWDFPSVPAFWDSFLLAFVFALLALHYVSFHNGIKKALNVDWSLEEKVRKYAAATIQRFWVLFFSGLICALGLVMFDNAGYTIAFAISLVFSSLGKPTPDRIIRLLRLKGEEREEVEQLKMRI
jgi:hypothetical protein